MQRPSLVQRTRHGKDFPLQLEEGVDPPNLISQHPFWQTGLSWSSWKMAALADYMSGFHVVPYLTE